MHKEVRKLAARLGSIPGVSVEQGKTHLRVIQNGRMVSALPVTPSDHRWRENCLADLRRQGITLPVKASGPPKIKPLRSAPSIRADLNAIWNVEAERHGGRREVASFVQQYAEANSLRGFKSISSCVNSLTAFSAGKTKNPAEWILFLLSEALPHYNRVVKAETIHKELQEVEGAIVSLNVDLRQLQQVLSQLGIKLEVR